MLQMTLTISLARRQEKRLPLAWCMFIHQNTKMARINNDRAHLARLRDRYAKDRTLPTSLARMGEILGFSSPNAVVKLCERLSREGYLYKGPGGKVLPAERFFELPLMDASIRAGTPDAIESQLWAEMMSLDVFLITDPSKTVLLRVKGDSMRDAGILDGDLAIVERTKEASEGQFVVAVVDGKFTLKELRFEHNRPVLIPHNPHHKPIRPESELEIYGVCRGLARSILKPTTRKEKQNDYH